MRGLLSKAMGILKSQIGSPRFAWCHNHPGCGVLDGNKECSVGTIGSAVSKLQGVLSNLLKEKLLFGYEVDQDFWKSWERLEERLGMATVGSNFMTLSNNQSFCINNFLSFLRHMRSIPLRSAQFFRHVSIPEGESIRSEGEQTGTPNALSVDDPSVQEFLNACNEANELILVLCHVTGGAPARSTELEQYKLRNSETAVRNLFVQQGLVMLLSKYNKTDVLTGREKPICRYLDKTTSRLVAQFLLLVRPLQSAILELKIGATASTENELYLFTKDGVRIPCERIRTIIPKWFVLVDVPFNFSDWRQWLSGVIQNFVSRNK